MSTFIILSPLSSEIKSMVRKNATERIFSQRGF
jgi:hypothetical protein